MKDFIRDVFPPDIIESAKLAIIPLSNNQPAANWVTLNKSRHRGKQIHLSLCGQFVLKRPILTDRKPIQAIPTVYLSRPEYHAPTRCRTRWMLQPYGKPIRGKLATLDYEELCLTLGNRWIDCHKGNAAVFRGKVVIIDW